METKIEEYVRARSHKDALEMELKEKKKPFLFEIEAVEEAMKRTTEDLSTTLAIATEQLRGLGEEIINGWDGPATVDLEDGTKVVRSTLRSLRVLNRRELLSTVLNLVQDDEKLPFTVKWQDKGIIPLVDANIIPPDIAEIETSYRLSVRPPKE